MRSYRQPGNSRPAVPRVPALALALALVVFAAPVAGQVDGAEAERGSAPWGLWNALGYGGLGFGLGVGGIWDDQLCGFGPCGGSVATVVGLSVAGLVGGAMIGRRASRSVARGEPLTPGHRTAVAFGTVLSGATLGALAAVPLINGEGEGTFLGSDETTFTLLALGGAGLMGVYLATRWDGLNRGPAQLQVSPVVLDGGRWGVGMEVGL